MARAGQIQQSAATLEKANKASWIHVIAAIAALIALLSSVTIAIHLFRLKPGVIQLQKKQSRHIERFQSDYSEFNKLRNQAFAKVRQMGLRFMTTRQEAGVTRALQVDDWQKMKVAIWSEIGPDLGTLTSEPIQAQFLRAGSKWPGFGSFLSAELGDRPPEEPVPPTKSPRTEKPIRAQLSVFYVLLQLYSGATTNHSGPDKGLSTEQIDFAPVFSANDLITAAKIRLIQGATENSTDRALLSVDLLASLLLVSDCKACARVALSLFDLIPTAITDYKKRSLSVSYQPGAIAPATIAAATRSLHGVRAMSRALTLKKVQIDFYRIVTRKSEGSNQTDFETQFPSLLGVCWETLEQLHQEQNFVEQLGLSPIQSEYSDELESHRQLARSLRTLCTPLVSTGSLTLNWTSQPRRSSWLKWLPILGGLIELQAWIGSPDHLLVYERSLI